VPVLEVSGEADNYEEQTELDRSLYEMLTTGAEYIKNGDSFLILTFGGPLEIIFRTPVPLI